MPNRATIRDMAELTGYSITTISLVLNNKPAKIPQSTRAKIWAAAEKLNYRPNRLAVSMVTKHTGVLGLIVPDNSNLFYAMLAKYAEEAARKKGYSMIYGNTDSDHLRDYECLRTFADRQVDGIIYTRSSAASHEADCPAMQFLQRTALPVVLLGREAPGKNNRMVVLNDFKGGYMATRHLLELGHRRIACLAGAEDISSSNARLEGYRAAMAEAMVPCDDGLIYRGNLCPGDERQAMDQFLHHGVTAIFSFNDYMAVGLYRECRIRGIHIPRDLSMVGFDNIPILDVIDPPLTTIDVPLEAMTACAVDLVVDMASEQAPEQQLFAFEPELVVRQSTAPPLAGAGEAAFAQGGLA